MTPVLLHITTLEFTNITLVIVLLFLFYRYLESFWSYKISRPFAWNEAVKNKLVTKELIRLEKKTRDKVRFYNLWFQVEQLRKNNVAGAFAELGVHRGNTAKSIHYMDRNRRFYLFDTFNGFSGKDLALESQTGERFSVDMFADTSIDKAQNYIRGNDNLQFKPGFFPDTTKGLEDERFALVNLDADLYAPTIEALRFFYPRLAEGGVIIVHDYNHNWKGLERALNEFMPTISESLIELPDWQGSAMIIKNSKA